MYTCLGWPLLRLTPASADCAVLSDPQQRAVYDVYGAAGLEAGRELAPYYNHAEELRTEYTLRRREQEHAQELAMASPQGRMSVKIDATPLFRPVSHEYDPHPLPGC